MMSLDLSKIGPKARARYLRIGKQYGSGDTLRQADKTLEGLAKYASVLALRGFGAEDAQKLDDARTALIAAGAKREDRAGARKVTSKAFLEVMRNGKAARERGRSILMSALLDLEEADDIPTAHKITAVLEQTSISADDAEKLAKQLELIKETLALAEVEAVSVGRGGAEGILHLAQCGKALRAAAKEREGAGTVAATEQMDLLDGIVVTLARSARRAARAAARELKMPALAAAFELTHLYRKGSGGGGGGGGEDGESSK